MVRYIGVPLVRIKIITEPKPRSTLEIPVDKFFLKKLSSFYLITKTGRQSTNADFYHLAPRK